MTMCNFKGSYATVHRVFTLGHCSPEQFASCTNKNPHYIRHQIKNFNFVLYANRVSRCEAIGNEMNGAGAVLLKRKARK